VKLSTKGRYAVMAMVDIAAHTEGRPIALADVAERQEISLSYLEQLFGKLRRGGLVKSVRGPGGGYLLAHGADDTRISDIILAVDEPQGFIIPNYNVGLSGNRAMVGTFTDDAQGENAGAVFLLEGVNGSDCNGNLIPDGCDIASGVSVDIGGNGVVNIDDLVAVLNGFGGCE